MLHSFRWYKYSLVVGFLKKTAMPCTSRIGPRVARVGPGFFANEAAGQDLLFRLAHLLKRELRSGIRESAGKKQDREELLRSLGILLKPYTPLKSLPFRIAINNFILLETASCCSIHLNDEELLMLWREVG
jgi:hypothetical protein